MTNSRRLVDVALGTYPSWWRERYRDEMDLVVESLLADGRSPVGVAINLVGSSLRVRFAVAGAPPSRDFWRRRTQRSLLVAALPWFAMVPLVATIYLANGQYGYVHGSSPIELSRAGEFARALSSALLWSVVAYLAVAVLGWRRLRRGLEGQPLATGRFRLVNTAAMVGVTLATAALFLGQHAATSTLAQRFAYVGLALVALSWVTLPAVIAQLLGRGELPLSFLRREVRLSAVLAGLGGLLALLSVADRVALALQPTPTPGASYWLYRSSLGGWEAPLLCGLVALSALSALGAATALRSYRRTIDL